MDEIKNYKALAEAYFKEGYNCSQAVALAFSDEIGLDRETLLKITSSFGGGMGRLREVCGAVSGMFIIAGLLQGYTSPNDIPKKSEHYALIQKLAKLFKEKNGSYVCRELISGASISNQSYERSAEYYNKRPCVSLVGDAAEILSEILVK